MYQWYDDGGPGEVTMKLYLRKQIMEFKRGGCDIGWSFVTTGREGFSTKPGNYRITEKIVDKYSNRYGWTENEWGERVRNPVRYDVQLAPGERFVPSPMPYWMRLIPYGIGIHAGPIPKPGETASHGCIRLPEEFIPRLFEQVKVGTPVTIVP